MLEDLSVEEEPAHLHPPSVDLPMRQPMCGSGGRYPEEAASEVPFVVMHPENAVKQLRCLEERLRQVSWMLSARLHWSRCRVQTLVNSDGF